MASRRLQIAWRRSELARPRRYLAVLSAVGLIHGLIAASMAGPLGLDALILLVPAAWMTGWLLRRRIAASRGATTLGVSVLAVLIGAFLSGTLYAFCFAAVAAQQGDWDNALEAVLFCWTFGFLVPGVTAIFMLPIVLLSLPLTWSAILVLREAAGGMVEFPGSRHGSAHLPS
jgi:hypothetical protein